MFLACTIAIAKAQTPIGGHIGFVLPLVTRVGGQTTNLGNNFSIGFPVGITIRGRGRMAFDMELVSSIQNKPRAVSLTVIPELCGVWDTVSELEDARLSTSIPHNSDLLPW